MSRDIEDVIVDIIEMVALPIIVFFTIYFLIMYYLTVASPTTCYGTNFTYLCSG